MTNHSIIEKLLEKAQGKYIPLQASLELTSICNHSCLHCYVDKKNKTYLSCEQWKIILDKLRDAGTLYIIFMGGEALLHPEFLMILNYAHELNFHTSLITNAYLIRSAQDAANLEKHGLNNITISLYSVDEKIHDELTTIIGSCSRAKNALELLKETKIQVGINTLLTNKNIDDYFLVQEFATRNGFGFNSDPVVTCDLLGKKCNLSLRPTEDQLRKHFYQKGIKWPESIPYPKELSGEAPICNMARSKCAVTCAGDLIPCIEIRDVLGNLLKEDFQTIWNSETANRLRRLKNCDLKNIFNNESDAYLDICPGMGLNEMNDSLTVPEFMKKLALIQEEVAKGFRQEYLLPFSGMSMWPIICDNDQIQIDFETLDYCVGDVVLARVDGELVVHRLIKRDEMFCFKGDYSVSSQEILKDNILGKCVGLVRGNQFFKFSKKVRGLSFLIALCSRFTMKKYPGILRRLFFYIVYILDQLFILFYVEKNQKTNTSHK